MVDFDGTCTEHDTTPLLPRLAAFASRQRSLVVSDCNESSEIQGNKKNDNGGGVVNNQLHMQDLERRMRKFQQLEEEYIRRYDEAKSSLLRAKNDDDSHLQHQSIHEMLDALDEPSTIVTQMVSESRVLEGLGHVDAEELGGILQLHTELTTTTTTTTAAAAAAATVGDLEPSEVKGECMGSNEGELEKVVVRLRPGCQRTLSRILSENCSSDPDTTHNEHEVPPLCWGWNVAVLSINWCPALIDASIVQPVLKQRCSDLRIDTCCSMEIPIWSNQVNADGIISLHVPGALAKRDRIKELRRNIQQSSDSKNIIVYVGDTSTDLAALLEADIGIIMGQISSSSSVKSVAERWGIQIVPLRHRRQHDFGMIGSDYLERWREQSILWQVESWMEIDEMLLELDEHWACDVR